MITITITGNVGKEPDMHYFDNGSKVTSLNVGSSYYDSKTKENKTIWFKCKIWGQKAEYVGEYVKKGSKVIVTGSLYEESYTSEDGTKRKNLCINANDIEAITAKKEDANVNNKQTSGSSAEDVDLDEIPF